MWEALSRYRGLVLVGVLMVSPLALLWAQSRAPGARGPVAGVLVDLASVIERGMLSITGAIDDVLTRYVTGVNATDELVSLRRQQGHLHAARVRIRELELENEELRRLAHVAERIDGPRPLGARVIGRSGAPLTRLARIDRGRIDGVRRGDGVVASAGVVGQVLVVGRYASDVLLLSDPASALDVVVQRTRARGMIRGTGGNGEYSARVEDFDRLSDVQVGDLIVTSGLGEHFPPGLSVGEVLQVTSPDDNLYQRADIRPSVDFSKIENVLVLIRREPRRKPLLADVDADQQDTPPGEGDKEPTSSSDAPSSSGPSPLLVASPPAARTAAPMSNTPPAAPVRTPPTGTTPQPVATSPPVTSSPSVTAPSAPPTVEGATGTPVDGRPRSSPQERSATPEQSSSVAGETPSMPGDGMDDAEGNKP